MSGRPARLLACRADLDALGLCASRRRVILRLILSYEEAELGGNDRNCRQMIRHFLRARIVFLLSQWGHGDALAGGWDRGLPNCGG